MTIEFSIPLMISLFFITEGTSFFLYPKRIEKLKKDMISSPGQIFIIALFAFLFGYLILEKYNVWGINFEGLMTLLGWLSVLKGIVLTVSPKTAEKGWSFFVGKKTVKNMYLYGAICIILGAYIFYAGVIL